MLFRKLSSPGCVLHTRSIADACTHACIGRCSYWDVSTCISHATAIGAVVDTWLRSHVATASCAELCIAKDMWQPHSSLCSAAGAFATGPTSFWLPPLMWLLLFRPKLSNVSCPRVHNLRLTSRTQVYLGSLKHIHHWRAVAA